LGPNAAPARRRASLFEELLESLREPLQLLLIAVGVLSAIWGELSDAIAIFVIIGAVASVETFSEMRAHRSLDALKQLSAPLAHVLRDGTLGEVPAAEIVPGDVAALEAGDRVPADCRVIEASGLRVDESALTGEPEPAAKGPEPASAHAALAERTPMLYAGTAVVDGEGRAVVVATGATTELGELGRLVAEEREPRTPLQKAMSELARTILVVAILVSVAVPLVGVLRGRPVREMVLAGLTIAFATIPEELPILVTVLLAVGGRRLARRGALLRTLRAGETLGAVTFVITDKTGTLTENRMRLARIVGVRSRVLAVALGCQAGGANDRAREPMEEALQAAAHADGIVAGGERVSVFPFDPQRKRMSAVWQTLGGVRVFAKGAPERVLEVCSLLDPERRQIAEQLDGLAREGLRVIALAEAEHATVPTAASEAERDLSFVGLVAFEDPLRDGVRQAVAALKRAGVKTIVVTGDHPLTATAVARRAGLPASEPMLGGLADTDEETLAVRLQHGTVIARATPTDKLRIVRALQRRGEVVAVTGDGVNDAPALSAANAGVAMGQRGTDLALEAADLVLTDDAYPTVVAAIDGGRNIASQLRRAVAFYLGAKIALVLTMLVPLALGLPAPFRPVHIVLLELFMDLGASVAFVSEPQAPDAMHHPPRDPARRFLDHTEVGAILAAGFALCTAALISYLTVRQIAGTPAGSAAAVAAWLIGHAGVAWILRARPRLSMRANPAFPIWAGAATATGVLLAASPLGRTLALVAPPAHAWAVIGGAVAFGLSLAAAARRTLGFAGDL